MRIKIWRWSLMLLAAGEVREHDDDGFDVEDLAREGV